MPSNARRRPANATATQLWTTLMESTVAFHSIWRSHVTWPSQMLKCNRCHGDFGQVLKSFRKLKKNLKKGLKIPKKIIYSLFHSVYIYLLVKFWIQSIVIIILWDIHTGGAPPCQTPVYIHINFNQEICTLLFPMLRIVAHLSVLYPCWQGWCSRSNTAHQRNQEVSDLLILTVVPTAWGYYPHTILGNITWCGLFCEIKTAWVLHSPSIHLHQCIWISRRVILIDLQDFLWKMVN